MCNEAVGYSLAALKLILSWFVTSKMIKKCYSALYSDDCLFFFMKILVMLHLAVMKWMFLV